jgi:hypothetical protein
MQPIPFAKQSYVDPTRDISTQRLVNMYLQPKEAQSKTSTALHGTPGLKLWATVGSGPCRGIMGMGDYLYVVTGAEVYRVDSSAVATLAGSVAGTEPVVMANNGTHVVFATEKAQIYAVGATDYNTLSVTDANGVAFQDGYLLFTKRDSQELFISALNDALTYDPLDFTLVNALPDLNVGIANLNRETWAFNERSTQVYYNSGAAAFPFDRNPSGVLERGCFARSSIAVRQGSVFWLGDDLRVYASQGYQAVQISTPPIDDAIEGLSQQDAAVAFTYSQLGHSFYALTFPGQATYVYDITTGLWHERQSDGRNDWRVRSYSKWFGKWLVGDAVNGNIYELDPDTYTDNGSTIRRVMTTPPLHANRQRLFFGRLEIDMERGVGLEGSGQGSDPMAMLDWTDDGGRHYSNELWRAMGKSGQYKVRATWDRLGSSFERTYRLSFSDAVKSVVIEAFHDMRPGGRR